MCDIPVGTSSVIRGLVGAAAAVVTFESHWILIVLHVRVCWPV